MSDAIGKALKEATIPDSSRKMAEVAHRASGRRASHFEPRRSSAHLVGGLAALSLAIFLSLTPPGRALAGDIAELVGIGDEPTLDQSRDQDLAANGRAVVVAAGTISGTDQPYEISAYEAGGPNSEASKKPNSCLNFDLPGLDRQSQVDFDSVCIDRPITRPLDVGGASDHLTRLDPEARFSINGLLSDEVADVSVTYEDASGERVEVPVVLAILDARVAEETGAPFTFGRFEAFFPDDGLPGDGPGVAGHPFFSTVEVVAFDADGDQIGKDSGKKFAQPPASIVAPDTLEACEEVADQGHAPAACRWTPDSRPVGEP